MSTDDKVRRSFALPRSLSDRLDAAGASGPGMTAIVVDALASWFARSGDDELELRFAHRLDRDSGQLARIERVANILLESHAQFVRYMLTVNAPVAEEDEAARALGRDRFNAFIESVARRLASGHRTFGGGEDQ